MSIRSNWTDYFMELAKGIATRATCDRRHVGAILTLDNRIISTGYNGSPPGLDHCDDVGHDMKVVNGRESCVRTIHAEMNAILAAARIGHATNNCSLYCTSQPCLQCAKAILTSGIISMTWDSEYPDNSALEFISSVYEIQKPSENNKYWRAVLR